MSLETEDINQQINADQINRLTNVFTNMQDSLSGNNMILILQQYIRYILGFIIFSNFMIIFWLKFLMNKKNKINFFMKNTQIEPKIKLKEVKDVKEQNSNDKDDKKEKIENSTPIKRHVLFVIAHPDDEIMFFYPTLYNLTTKTNAIVNILCLTNGDFYGQGKIREKEFINVCEKLGIKESNYQIIDNKENFKDGPIMFDEKLVNTEIENFLEKRNIKIDNVEKIEQTDENQIEKNLLSCIITFDEKGITNHPNHISCTNGVISFIKKHKPTLMKNNVEILLLNSYNAVMQYFLQILNLIFFCYIPQGFACLNIKNHFSLMSLYKSQFFMYRKLHIIFSVYSYINLFTRIEFISDDEPSTNENNTSENNNLNEINKEKTTKKKME